jgi:hypothetical protein
VAGLTVKSANGKAESLSDTSKKDFKQAQPITGQPVGSNRRALDTISIGVYQVANNQVVEAGSNDNLVKKTAHSAKVGDIFRIQTSANNIGEFEVHIEEIVDANNFRLSCILSANLAAGDLYTLLRPVSQRFTSDGASLSSVTSGPIAFQLNGVQTTVTEDTVVPGNNIPMPVKITSATGPINITAGDLNVQLSDIGVNADVTRVGDGTGRYLNLTTNSEAKTRDNDANTTLTAISGKLPAALVAGKLSVDTGLTPLTDTQLRATPVPVSGTVTANTGLSQPLTDTQLRATAVPVSGPLTDTQLRATAVPVSGSVSVSNFPATQAISAAALPLPTGAATSALQTTGNTSLGNIDTNIGAVANAAVTNPASSGSVIALLKGLLSLITSTNTKLDLLETDLSPNLYSSQTQTIGTGSPSTFTAPAGALKMQICNNAVDTANPIRWTPSAETPSASNGQLLIPTAPPLMVPAGSIKAIALNGSADVTVTWYV